MAISQSEMQVLYARYLKSGMTLEDFCKKQQVTYIGIWWNGLTNGKSYTVRSSSKTQP